MTDNCKFPGCGCQQPNTCSGAALDAVEGLPEALRLAAWLTEAAWRQMRLGDVEAAGRELRRLHAENEALVARLAAWEAGTASNCARIAIAAGDKLLTENKALRVLLADARRYVAGAYECAFPDQSENDAVLAAIDVALETRA